MSRILTLIETAITGRILSPSAFGVYGIGLLVLSLIEIITETGINIFLIQEKDSIDTYVDTAWFVSIIRGIIICLVIVLLSPLIVYFFHAPSACPMLFLVAFVPLIRGFINPSEVKFQKDLTFHKEFYFRSTLFFVETGVTLLLIVLTRSVYSLVIGIICSALAEVIISFRIKPIPQFEFHKERFRKVVHFGKWITLSTILNYFYQNGDNMAVGRMLGTGPLGYYDMAYRISLVPLTDLSDVIKQVSFPLYVKVVDDKKRLQRAFLRSFLGMLGLVIPVCLILYFFPTLIVHIILGDKWLPIVPVLKVLAIFGVVRAISTFSTGLFLAVKRQQVGAYIACVGLVGLLITIVPFVLKWGMVGAAWSALFGTTLTIPVAIYYYFETFR